MNTINMTDKGKDFIDKLNENFAECMAGGSGDVSVSVPLQGGKLEAATGYVDGRWCATGASNGVGTWTDDGFYNYLHTPLYLSLNGNKVNDVTVPTGSTLTIFCYDATFAMTGTVNDEDNIPDGTAYVKLQLNKSNGYPTLLALDMELAAEPKWVKNMAEPFTQQWFNYECHPPKLWDDANYTEPHELPTDDSADVDNTRYHDNGMVMLPPNYSPTGVPTKVVLWFDGDSIPWFIMHSSFKRANGNTSVYEMNFKYLNAMGYAVVQCSGYTSMWKDESGSTDAAWWFARISPAYIASVRALYDHIMSNYNFDPAVYIAAKSAGGGMLMHTALTQPFPVRAAAGMSVILSNFDTMRYSNVRTQKTWQKRLGCSNWDDFVLSSSGSGSTATIVHNASGANANQTADAARLAANKDVIRKYDAFGMLTDIDWDAFVTQCLKLTTPFNDGANYPSALTDIIFASSKVVNTPIKLWSATKDNAVPYTWHKIVVDWVNRNGGIAELRSYTGDDGQHHTFCGSSEVFADNLPTPYGGVMNDVNIGFVEAVEWFKRW